MIETFPAAMRVAQKDKRAAEKPIAGIKPQPQTRPVQLEPGSDDCGEDGISTRDGESCISVSPEPRRSASSEMKRFRMECEGGLTPDTCGLDLELPLSAF